MSFIMKSIEYYVQMTIDAEVIYFSHTNFFQYNVDLMFMNENIFRTQKNK